MKKTTYLPYFAGATMSLIFGLSFLAIKEGLQHYTPIELLSYRFTLAAIVLTALAVTKRIKINLSGKPVRMLVLLSVFEPICYFACETMGIKLTSVSETSMFIALIPIVVCLLACFILKERPFEKQAVFILISVSGAIFNIVMSGNFEHKGDPVGILFLIGAVLSAGGYNIMSRKSSKVFSPMEITFVMMWIAAIFYNILLAFEIISRGGTANPGKMMTLSGAIPILYLGVMCSICAYFLLNYILSKLSAASASVFTQLTIIVGIISGVVIAGESLHWYQIAGATLIITGVFGTTFYENKRRKAAEEAAARENLDSEEKHDSVARLPNKW